MKLFKNKYFIVTICTLLQLGIVSGIVFGGISYITTGEEIDCEAVAAQYNANVPDTSKLFILRPRAVVSAMIDITDEKLSSLVSSSDIEASIYSDSTVTAVTKLYCDAFSIELSQADFTALENEYPDAYSYLAAAKQENKDWKDIENIPFGIENGNKNAFIKGCGIAASFSDSIVDGGIKELSGIYNDVFVPVMESLHTGTMPSMISFALKTKLDERIIMEFMIEKTVSVLSPFKAAPASYLFEMLPDLITTYNNANDYIKRNNLDINLPELQPLIDAVFEALELEGKAFDINYMSRLGTATVQPSGRSGGKSVYITGDKESVFLYLADYLVGLIIKENDFFSLDDIL